VERKVTTNLFQRINAVMKEVDSVNKGTTVSITQTNSYKAVSHDDVTALLHRPLTNAGIVAMPNMDEATVEPYQTEKEYNGKITKSNGYLVKVWASVTFVNVDDPADKVTTRCYSYALDSGDKAVGKAYSMAVKYCYLKTFMLESSDEEESREFESGNKDVKINRNYGDNQPNYSNPTKQEQRPPSNNTQAPKPASEAQLKAISRLYGKDYVVPANITSNQASDLIKNAPANKGK
jgi:hypothetical protein